MTLQEQLKEKNNFTENEKIIADYILSHKDDVLQMSIQSLALKTFTSTSAIMRLCTRLNLVGFKDSTVKEANDSDTAGNTENAFYTRHEESMYYDEKCKTRCIVWSW